MQIDVFIRRDKELNNLYHNFDRYIVLYIYATVIQF